MTSTLTSLFSKEIFDYVFYLNIKKYFTYLISALQKINDQILDDDEIDEDFKINLSSNLDGGGPLKTCKNVSYNLEKFNENVRFVSLFSLKIKE